MAKKRGLKDAAADPLMKKEKGLVEERAGIVGKTTCIGKVLLALFVGIGTGLVMERFFKFPL